MYRGIKYDADYKSYGNSIIVNSLRDMLVEFDNLENSWVNRIDMEEIEKIKYYLPLKNIL